MSDSKKILIDLHLHTSRHSACSVLPAERLIATALEHNLQGVVITEHNYCWPQSELDELLEQAGNPPFLLMAGCEVRVTLDNGMMGDLIVLGCADNPERDQHIDDLCRQVHAQGGIVIAPHPFAPGRGIEEEVYSARIDAIEVFNNRYNSADQWARASEAQAQLSIPAIAGSDSHDLETIGRCCTEFDAGVSSLADVIAAIKNHQCRPLARPAAGGIFKSLFRR